MVCVGTSIFEETSTSFLSTARRPSRLPRYTLNCEEPQMRLSYSAVPAQWEATPAPQGWF